ncbi:hypothetical protein [Streptomyces sp. NPDC096152]|uniref:hypothetical protein n=1 Tax=Streptomyces sp. NPDC096152 TaxID=3366078 RepID=UPI00381E3DF9
MDWREDDTLSAQIRGMSRRQRHQAAYLALRRLQAPLVSIEMPADWGIDPAAVTTLLRKGAARLDGEADEGLAEAIVDISSAPLFESEVEPELTELFQLEAINGWLLLGNALGEMSEEQTHEVVGLAREMATYLDSCMDDSLTVVDGEECRERYLAGADERLRAYGLGYFGTRNLEIERACHEAILAAPGDSHLLESPAGSRLEAACDEYSSQLLPALRAYAAE